jgi:pyridoxal phosphate enzyme (YggS family)
MAQKKILITMPNLQKNLNSVLENISKASLENSVDLVVVTKNQTVNLINQCISLGVNQIGENRVQEAENKFSQLFNAKIKKRMIGRLQSNKIKNATKIFDSIDSVSKIDHLKKINSNAELEKKSQNILLQINITNDQNKDGFIPRMFLEKIEDIFGFNYVNIEGMMTIGRFGVSKKETSQDFKKMKNFYDQINSQLPLNKKMGTLSMGMSQDYQVAIQEGSTMVRVGGAIFG